MRHPRIARGGLLVFVLTWMATTTGCTHNYYMYENGPPPCGPTAVAPTVVTNGAVCAVPAQGPVVAEGSTRTTVVTGSPVYVTKPPRVVVSEPKFGNRLRWRRSDPDAGLATTRVEGAYDDETANK